MKQLLASMALVLLGGPLVTADSRWVGGSPAERAAIGDLINTWKQGYADAAASG